MEHIPFGRTGLRVCELCLGTMTFGFQCDEPASVKVLDAAFDAGIDFFDTADVYPLGGGPELNGVTEEILGRWLKGKRDEVILATKCAGNMGVKPWQQGTSRKHILDAIDASLRRLGTDYVDLYQLHGDDPSTPLDETLAALDDVVTSGRARYVGVSNWFAYRLARALGRSEALGVVQFVSSQPRYNLLFRQIERDLLPLCLEDGVAVIPYNPIAGGVLSGKYPTLESVGGRFSFERTGAVYRDRYWHDREFATVEALRDVAADAGLPIVTMAVAWVAAHPAITAPIIGASRPDQLADNVAAAGLALEPGVKQRLDDLTSEYRKGDAVR